MCGSGNILTQSVLNAVFVSLKTVAVNGTVTQGNIVVDCVKIELLFRVHCCDFLESKNQLVRSLSKLFLFFSGGSSVELLIEAVHVLAKSCKLRAVNVVSYLEERVIKLRIVFLGVRFKPLQSFRYIIIEICLGRNASFESKHDGVLDLCVPLYIGVSKECATDFKTNPKTSNRASCGIVTEAFCNFKIRDGGVTGLLNTVLLKFVIELAHSAVYKVLCDGSSESRSSSVDASQVFRIHRDVVNVGSSLNIGSYYIIRVVESIVVGVVNALKSGIKRFPRFGNSRIQSSTEH